MRGPRALEVPPGAAAARSGARRGGPRTEDAPEAARASTAPPPPGAQPLRTVRAPAEGKGGLPWGCGHPSLSGSEVVLAVEPRVVRDESAAVPLPGARGPGQAPLRDPAAYPATERLCAGSPAAFGLGRSLSAACAET